MEMIDPGMWDIDIILHVNKTEALAAFKRRFRRARLMSIKALYAYRFYEAARDALIETKGE